ncbi:hypothetical protein Scep_015043 [Stephania cephalantha]|uniref:Aminotransferase-like plant mobile domain-containing protein n=1 Tax=Stephania cephalantha TaxID=152367 RepID=A0AAP0J4J6_9MAGN
MNGGWPKHAYGRSTRTQVLKSICHYFANNSCPCSFILTYCFIHRWLDAFSVSQNATHVVSAYRDALDSQRHEDDVVWQPYNELMGSLPVLYKWSRQLALDVSPYLFPHCGVASTRKGHETIRHGTSSAT